MLSKQQLRALAREARALALESVEGTAPHFGIHRLHAPGDPATPVCALGHIYFRALGSAQAPFVSYNEKLWHFRDMLLPAMEVLVEANNDSAPAERCSAVVFPLLAYADAVEAIAKALP